MPALEVKQREHLRRRVHTIAVSPNGAARLSRTLMGAAIEEEEATSSSGLGSSESKMRH